MTKVEAKSNENYEAGGVLINNGMYASSIHCFYYSCFQLTKRALVVIGESYSAQDCNSRGNDSHCYISGLLETDLKGKDICAQLDYNVYLNKLKKMRVIADYKQAIITDKNANDASSWAAKINNILKTQYQL